jgi:hypothetical protein
VVPDAADERHADAPGGAAYWQMARVQVNPRFAPDAPRHEDWNAIPFKVIRDDGIPANDLYAVVLFARMDERLHELREANNVWTADLITDEWLRGLDWGTRSSDLEWSGVLSWREHRLASGAHEITPPPGNVPVPDW